MREIKFRLRLKSKVADETIQLLVPLFDECVGLMNFPVELNEWEVLSIDRYTGLKDKSGKEIFEGDIVLNDGYKYEPCIINFYQGQFIGRYKPLTPQYSFDESLKIGQKSDLSYIGLGFYVCERNSIEVIGNIYENPELLEGK